MHITQWNLNIYIISDDDASGKTIVNPLIITASYNTVQHDNSVYTKTLYTDVDGKHYICDGRFYGEYKHEHADENGSDSKKVTELQEKISLQNGGRSRYLGIKLIFCF